MSVFICVDIGGTQIRAAIYPQNSTTPLEIRKIPTQAPDGTAFERMVGLIESIFPKDEAVSSITVASPGPINPETGVITSAPNIPGWDNFPLGDELKKKFGVPIHIGNDANLAALGEWKFGAGRGHKHVLYLTISTGIGGGVIVDNQLLLGTRGLAAELGHITVAPDGPMCNCGQRGHLEAVASGPAITAYVNEKLNAGAKSILKSSSELNAEKISKAAQQGDALALEAYARAAHFIGRATADFLHTFNPSVVIFGGGVSFAGDILFKPLHASLESSVMDTDYLKDLIITTAALGDDAGLLGALALAHTKLEK